MTADVSGSADNRATVIVMADKIEATGRSLSARPKKVRLFFQQSRKHLFILLTMLHEISQDVYRLIREYGDLTKEEVAKAIDRERQAVYRWETAKKIPNLEQEAILDKISGITRLSFAEAVCKAVSNFLNGQRVEIGPKGEFLASVPLVRASRLYGANFNLLTQEQRKKIEEKLRHGRAIDLAAEQQCNLIEAEIDEFIKSALDEKKQKRKSRQ